MISGGNVSISEKTAVSETLFWHMSETVKTTSNPSEQLSVAISGYGPAFGIPFCICPEVSIHENIHISSPQPSVADAPPSVSSQLFSCDCHLMNRKQSDPGQVL